MVLRLRIIIVAFIALILVFAASSRASAGPPPPLLNTTTTTRTFSDTPAVSLGNTLRTITVSGLDPYLWDLDLLTDITTPALPEMNIFLKSPAGTEIILSTYNQLDTNGAVWDDYADHLATDAFSDGPPPYVPEEALGAFIGEDPNGTWTLEIENFSGVTAFFEKWSLTFTTIQPVPTYTTATFSDTADHVVTTDFSTTIDVSGLGPYLSDLDLTTFIEHDTNIELVIRLISPAGTTTMISSLNPDWGPWPDIFNGTHWDDQAGMPVTDFGYPPWNPVLDPVWTPVTPEGAMSAFIGEDPNGIWMLTIYILSIPTGNPGLLSEWSLEITTAQGPGPDLTLIKNDGVGSVHPGEIINYSLLSANIGAIEATGVEISETVPDDTVFEPSLSTPGWSCAPDNLPGSFCTLEVGTLAAGASSGPVVYAVKVVDLPAGLGIENTARIGDDGSKGPDLEPTNNLTVEVTPVILDPTDLTGPVVTAASPLGILEIGPAVVRVSFSEDVRDPLGDLGVDDVTNPNNYLLIQPGLNGLFDTVSCAGGMMGDDRSPYAVGPVVYDDQNFTASIEVNGKQPLPIGVYRVFVCGTTSIEDWADNPLNDGAGDYTFDFRVFQGQPDLPETGFAPGIISRLSDQPADKLFTSYSGMTLEIPALNLATDLIGVPWADEGWEVAWLGDRAGYLHGTAFPTWPGNTVITAHVWDANNQPGPFWHLKRLGYGDEVRIRAWGQVYTYLVQDSYLMPPEKQDVFQHEELDWVTLITCEGYNSISHTYAFRRIVRAVLEDVSPSLP